MNWLIIADVMQCEAQSLEMELAESPLDRECNGEERLSPATRANMRALINALVDAFSTCDKLAAADEFVATLSSSDNVSWMED